MGLTYESAARRAGVHRATFHKWNKWGKDAIAESLKTGKKVKADKRPYADLHMKLEKAKAEAEFVLAKVIKDSAVGGYNINETYTTTVMREGKIISLETKTVSKVTPPDWRAAQTILSSRHGWAQRQQMLNINLDEFTDEELELVSAGEDPLNIIANRLATESAS